MAQTVASIAHLYGTASAEGNPTIQQLSHQDIADIIGAARPSVTLSLRKLKDGGFIELSNEKITVLNYSGLLDRQYE